MRRNRKTASTEPVDRPWCVGRLISFRMFRCLDSWPCSDNAHCLEHDSCQNTLNDEIIFISHHWITPQHPDPYGTKKANLDRAFDDLKAMLEEFRSIKPQTINREKQREMLERRRMTPIMPATYFNEWPDHHFGIPWDIANSKREAAKQFHTWLLESVEKTLAASLWIDSWATPNEQHREDCHKCRPAFGNYLAELPRIIDQTTCVVIDSQQTDDHQRDG